MSYYNSSIPDDQSFIEFASSSDNGNSWYQNDLPHNAGYNYADPSIAFTPDGKTHINYLSNNISINSSNNIFSNNPVWNGPFEVNNRGDKPWLNSDMTAGSCSGVLYSTYSDSSIKNKMSSDIGLTWSSIGNFNNNENDYVY